MYTLFLPGSFRRSKDYRWLTGQLSEICDYYTIDYPLPSSVAKLNQEIFQSDALLEVRREIIYGSRAILDSRLSIADEESVLGSFLSQVRKRNSHAGSIEEILSKTLIIGHSQGAGHAALISLEFDLKGTLLIAGPSDSYQGVPSAWTKLQARTPPNRCKMYVHVEDRHARLSLHHGMMLGLKKTCILTELTDLQEVVSAQIVIDTRAMPPLKSHDGITSHSPDLDEFNKSYLVNVVNYYRSSPMSDRAANVPTIL